jgi:RND family efflux transporter MFP subunit
VAVTAGAVELLDRPAIYEATGTVRAATTAVIASKILGHVEHVYVQAGDRVQAGQTLAILDARDLDAAVKRAEAGRVELSSAIPEADNAVAAAKANLDLARATFGRIEDLAAKKSVSNQEFDEASARLKSAEAAHEMARARRRQLDSRAAQAEQEVRSAGIARDFARITAPFAGVVISKSAEPGTLATPGAPLLTLERAGGYRLEAALDESRLPHVLRGQSVAVSLDAIGARLTARVTEIVPLVDAASRSYIVKLDLPAAAGLRSGMFGRAAFPGASEKRLMMPAAALIERGQLQSVLVIEEGVGFARLVTTGRREQDRIEVLTGLRAGERVVLAPPPSLHDGDRVEVRP